MEILSTRNLTKEFPGVLALDKVNFNLEEGEIHGLVGENGAGKSTLVKVLSGVYPPTHGEIYIKGEKISFNSPKDSLNLIGVVYQERELIPYFNGIQNLFLGQEKSRIGFLSIKEMMEEALNFAKKYDLEVDLNTPVCQLNSGKQEMITILKILFREPKIMIFDEPTAPLSLKESEILFNLIRQLKEEGITILYISHRLEEIENLCDRISILRNGKMVCTAKKGELSQKEIIELMIDKEFTDQYPIIDRTIGSDLLNVKNYCCIKEGIDDISFHIRAGEIVGFGGLVGSGRTELAKAIFTGTKKDQGIVYLDNQNLKSKKPSHNISQGLVMVPEDRRNEGTLVQLSVSENLSLPHLNNMSSFGFLNFDTIKEHVNNIVKALSIKIFSLKQEVWTLSGGNQQKVSLGKWFGKDAKVWIFDEPTRGIDVESKREIYLIMQKLAKDGCGIWFISSDLRELTAICNRVYIMKDFKIVSEFSKPFDSKALLSAMLGGNIDG
ncbi:MAG TPA: sugar ABC transporter ATP-binding protein [Defluviitoga sp.]|nr:sugar ABC transporter ATP-binding protein [Defluviitoga sp.]HPZ29540.1 sugar ABC transporter ATP-binding protein [Defluviitoga sp.]